MKIKTTDRRVSVTNTPLDVNTDDIILSESTLDAFSRLRVSNPTSLFSTQCQYNTAGLQMETGATGTGVSGSHSADTRMVAISATAGTGTSFIQSYRYIPYQAGKSHLIAITGVLGAGVANTTTDIGYFDSANGIFLRQNGTSGLQLVRRTSTSGSVVNNVVNKADWTYDGALTNVSIDETKAFILIIDLQFLGMGRVRIGFDIDGRIVWVHEFLNAGVLSVPYMQSATLPIGMLVTASASGSTKTAYFKCASVMSEGGANEDFGFLFSTPDVSVTAGNGARTHLLSIRPKTTFNGITNRTLFELKELNLLVTGNNPVFWELCLGQAISGTVTYNDINTTYSAYEYNTAGTISGSPTTVIASGYIPATNQTKFSTNTAINNRYPITLDRAGAVRAMGTLTLLVTGIGGTSATRGAINFIEIR